MTVDEAMLVLESTLVNDEKVDYIEIQNILECIHIIVSKKTWDNVLLSDRIMSIYSLLEFEHEDILNSIPVIVECLSPKELDELFKLYAKQD